MRLSAVEIGLGLVLAFGVMIWPDPLPLVKWGGLALGVGLIVWGAWGLQRDRASEVFVKTKWLPMWSLRLERADPWPLRRLIPLQEAVKIAYEQTHDTEAARVAESVNQDNVLGYYAHALFDGGSTLYGKHPPSRELEPIPGEENRRCRFSDDQSAIHRYAGDSNLYEDIHIKLSDLRRRIKELRELG